jgi:DNA segregation ATPase FtsK/SpoIIIE, S-DNA-T family
VTTIAVRVLGTPAEPAVQRDVVIHVSASTTVGDVASSLASSDPAARLSLYVEGDVEPVDPMRVAVDGCIFDGCTVLVVDAAGPPPREPLGSLNVVSGPDEGRSFPLFAGPNIVGRGADADVQLSDRLASRHHAELVIDENTCVRDLGSLNGVQLDGEPIAGMASILPGHQLALGNTIATIDRTPPRRRRAMAAPTIGFNRPPRVLPETRENVVVVPSPPGVTSKARIPMTAALAPLLLGSVMLAFAPSGGLRITSMLFMFMSPVMAVGSYLENRARSRREHGGATSSYRGRIAEATSLLESYARLEANDRHRAAPRSQSLLNFAEHRSERLWERGLDDSDALQLRVGIATVRSRTGIVSESSAQPAIPSVDLADLQRRFGILADVPAVVSLRDAGVLGVSGGSAADPLARALVAQVAGLHSPADVVIAAIVPAAQTDQWKWLAWLPHVSGLHNPLGVSPLAAESTDIKALVTALDSLIATREKLASDRRNPTADTNALPSIVLLVSEQAAFERSALTTVLGRGPAVNVLTVWMGASRVALPTECRAVLDVESDGERATFSARGSSDIATGYAIEVEGLTVHDADAFARFLAPVVDLGRAPSAGSSLPKHVTLSELVTERGPVDDPTAIAGRWDTSRSERTLAAPIGMGTHAPFLFDLRHDGPHGLVAGTTGSGKSELLQTLVASLAAHNDPARLTFLLVDYKGGSAFGSCVSLPHTVGLVTDLSVTEVRRALHSLTAELQRRERIITEHAGAKDLAEMERMGHPDTPPSLLIVVDEFAALSHEVPEFVAGMVNVAQRGRSLGLHLLLATQRPSGVITDAIRANTNIRIALRTADATESQDVLGTDLAAGFSGRTPGRAAARIGATTTTFQSAFVGGTTEVAATASVMVHDLGFGPLPSRPSSNSGSASTGNTDLARVVQAVRAAASRGGFRQPRRPWLDPLPGLISLESVEADAAAPDPSSHDAFPIGVLDLPKSQTRAPFMFDPERNGSLLVLGTSGTGKTMLLRTLAASCARASTPLRPTFVYALDFGGRALTMIEALPNVGSVIPGDDHERITRLLRLLRSEVEDRSQRYRELDAESLSEFRQKAERLGLDAEPLIVLLVDNYAGFHAVYEQLERGMWAETLAQLIVDGRAVGVHVVITADRRQVIPPAINAAISRRLVLRLASIDDYAIVGIGRDLLGPESPAGRGISGGDEVQVAVFGGSTAGEHQALGLRDLARSIDDQIPRRPRPIESLPNLVPLTSLPAGSPTCPTVAVGDALLDAVGIALDGHFLVAGPARTGRTTALLTIAAALRRSDAPGLQYWLSLRPVDDLGLFDGVASGGAVRELSQLLVDAITADDQGDLGPMTVFIDDLIDLLPDAGLLLNDLSRLAKTRPITLIASGESVPLRRAFDQASQEIRSARRGLLLAPDLITDGDLLGVTLPRLGRPVWPAGRGFLVERGAAHLVQWATPN